MIARKKARLTKENQAKMLFVHKLTKRKKSGLKKQKCEAKMVPNPNQLVTLNAFLLLTKTSLIFGFNIWLSCLKNSMLMLQDELQNAQ